MHCNCPNSAAVLKTATELMNKRASLLATFVLRVIRVQRRCTFNVLCDLKRNYTDKFKFQAPKLKWF